ncbi:MAG: MFS transporter, partial [Gemmatimonadetes bacterium]|nr:MFS transporter [Gemmatimonadota bacterium]
MNSTGMAAATTPADGRSAWDPASRTQIASWTLYDFGSSAFNTLMVTFIFHWYFVNVVAADTASGTVIWRRAVMISALVVAILMPILGAAADYGGRKKQFLVGFALMSIAATVALFFVG